MSTMEEWITEAKAELGIDLDVDVTELLALAKLVAHKVARPAAPVTAFLVGYAAAQADGGPTAVTAASRRIAALAGRRTDVASSP
jgi:Domain of unknown function (DUF6457)